MNVRTRHTGQGRLIVGALTLALLAGCTPETDPSGDPEAGPEQEQSQGTEDAGGEDGATATPLTEGAPQELEQFYAQQLEWTECESTFECASLTVPIDYADPEGQTIDLALLRAPAGGQAQGSVVVNPGGPGGSGVDYAQLSGMVLSGPVREVYDVVGFDPRGVGRSAPITCFTDEQMDEFLSSDPTPDDEAEEQASEELVQEFAQACGDNAPDLVGHLSTVEVARDLDVLRAALGDESLTYLGASYGTFIGSTYATLFPDRVGRLVLDGAIDPGISGLEMSLGQAGGFEQATRAYVEDCVASGSCPLGEDVEAAMQRIPAFLDELDADPIPLEGDAAGELTEGWGLYGIIVAMYDEGAWPVLSQAFEAAFNGDGTLLMYLANAYASRGSDGSYDGNGMQAIYAVNCLDRPAQTGSQDLDDDAVLAQFEEASPTWGRYLAGDGACEYWPAEASETVEDYSAVGADPILVIGTTGDPATPYEWAEGLADTLDSGVLLTYEGEGHTAYGRSNDCIDDIVDAYLIDGTVPEDGQTC